jgi:hypothetical protein
LHGANMIARVIFVIVLLAMLIAIGEIDCHNVSRFHCSCCPMSWLAIVRHAGAIAHAMAHCAPFRLRVV